MGATQTTSAGASEAMETRKLQLIGGGASYAVCLPKPWIESHGLKAGDEVVIENRSNGELGVRTGSAGPVQRPERKLVLESRDPDEILRSLIGLYVSGFQTALIDHHASDPQAVQTGVGEACSRLQGLQVVEEGVGRIVLQDLSDTRTFNLDRGLRRIQILAQQMLVNVGRLAAGGGDPVMRESDRYETELDRLALLLLRDYAAALRGPGFPSPTATVAGLNSMFAVQYLERIGDYAMRVSRSAQFLARDPAQPVTEAIKTHLGELVAIVADASKAFNARDNALANDVIRRAARFGPAQNKEGLFDVFTSPRSKPQLYSCVRCIQFFGVLESLERVALYAKSIAETAINLAALDEPTASPSRNGGPRE